MMPLNLKSDEHSLIYKLGKFMSDNPLAYPIFANVLWLVGFTLVIVNVGWFAASGIFFLLWANNIQMRSLT